MPLPSPIQHPAYGFGAYYEWALDRTLYILPYGLAFGLSYLMPVCEMWRI